MSVRIFSVFAMCANGNHDVVTKYGMVGILTAVFCFPIGLLALLYVPYAAAHRVLSGPDDCFFDRVDKERRCVRCGALVNV